ncbi:MAG: hypothetical protein IJS08_17490 [Victivallales bacterium]|nr:hypothetical protein [Victivallales bacterium]
MKKTIFALLVSLVCIVYAGEKKALVYMMDGLRADIAELINAPVWQSLKENSWAENYKTAWSVQASNDIYTTTSSAPNHTCIAVGRYVEDHKVKDNKSFTLYDENAAPTFMKTLYTRLNATSLFAFSWASDRILIPQIPTIVLARDDAKNNLDILNILQNDKIPSAFLVFDDAPDHGGHGTGFYPYGADYIKLTGESFQRFGKLLEAIKERPQFKNEDWLIVLCSDHGGYGKSHGMRGGQASTVPLLFCAKDMPSGYLKGSPNNIMIVPTVMRHFGLDDEAQKLPGNVPLTVNPPPAKPSLERDLLYAIAVKDEKIVNAAGDAKFTVNGTLPVSGDCFDLNDGSGFITLDALKGSDAKNFSFAMTIELNPDAIKADPPIFSNKNWQDGTSDGFVFFVSKKTLKANFARRNPKPDYLAPNAKRLDLYDFDLVAGKKTLLACSVGDNGLITILQKHPDGKTYWVSVSADGINCNSALDWNIGQDGTGNYKAKSLGKISDFRFWNRALSLDELRSL